MTDHASASQETGRGTRAPMDAEWLADIKALAEAHDPNQLVMLSRRTTLALCDSHELLRSALSALREENERLRTDGELLDWFDWYAVVDACNLTDEDGERRVCILELLDPNLVLARLVNDGGDDGAPIREIIAAARAAAPLRDAAGGASSDGRERET
jgi:hypothetical protein